MTENKNILRKQMKEIRKSMNAIYKKECDNKIFHKLISSEQYENSDVILCYVSTEIEVDTRQFINYALNDGKKIAIPRCFENGCMIFFEINSLDNLERSAFGIDEPSDETHRRIDISALANPLCIVPALAFDRQGMRLGYGGGYYDRFLSQYSSMPTIGICYSSCINEKISGQIHDIKIKNIITENEYIGGQ